MGEQFAGGGHHIGGEIMLARRGAGDDRHQIALGTGALERRPQQLLIVAGARIPDRHTAPFADESRQHRRIEIDHRAWRRFLAGLNQLITGGNDADPRPRLDPHRRMTGRQQRAQIVGAQPMGTGQQQLGGDDVFTDQAHMIPRRHRFENLDGGRIDLVHFLDHDDGVGPGRQRVTGIDIAKSIGTRRIGIDQCEFLADELRRAEGLFRAHADPIHRRGMIMRRGDLGEHRLGGNPVEGVVDGNLFDR